MNVRLTPERRLLTPRGGNRYVEVSLEFGDSAPSPFDLVYAVDGRLVRQPGLVARLQRALSTLPPGCTSKGMLLSAGAHVLPSLEALADVSPAERVDLRTGWLEACLALATDEPPLRPQHCLLVTDAACDLDEREAMEVWDRAWIATSVLSLRPRSGWAQWCRWAGGQRLREPCDLGCMGALAGRVVLDVQAGPGVVVQMLAPRRGLRQHGAMTEAVVGDARRPVARGLLSLRYPPRPSQLQVQVRARWRLQGQEHISGWTTLQFELGDRPELADAAVMKRVAKALAKELPVPRPGPAAGSRPLRLGDAGDGSGTLVGRFVPAVARWASPQPEVVDEAVLRDACRGCLLWAGVASALGKGLEGLHPATIRARYGAAGAQHLEPWLPGLPDTAGMVSGDIQVLREVGTTLVEHGGTFDPVDFAARLVQLLPRNRGIGNAAVEAAHALLQGDPWYQAGLAANSAGNGAAMRVAPIGLASALDPNLLHLYRDAVLSALPSHTHPIGVSAAVVMAAAVGHCLRLKLSEQPLDAVALLTFVADLIRPIERDAVQERRPGGRRVRFSERLLEVGTLLSAPPEEAFNVLWNGSFALESVPAALYCFLRQPENPRQTVLVAVNGGFDADTVGGMAAQLAGVWNGAARLQREAPAWWAGLEMRDDLLLLADGLAELAQATGKEAVSRRPN